MMLSAPRRRRSWLLVFVLALGLGLPAFSPGHAAAATGSVWTWGDDGGEQLANGAGMNARSVPGPALLNGAQLADFKALGAGISHTLAVKNDGTVWAWGSDASGELGDGTRGQPTSDPTPKQVVGLAGVVAVAGGADFSLALKGDGTVWAWGSAYDGQLGNGVASNPDDRVFATPQQTLGLTNVVAIAANGAQSLAVEGDGTVWAWGVFCHDLINEPGSPGFYDCATPRQVAGLAGITAVAFSYHNAFALALRADGVVLSWGRNLYGELGRGDGLGTSAHQAPAPVVGLSGVVAIAAGTSHSLALKGDGTVWAWGQGASGQLGDGQGGPHTTATPRQAVGLSGIAAIAAANGGSSGPSANHNLALKNDGTVYAWGQSDSGQLGLGDATAAAGHVATPSRIPGLRGVTAIGAGTLFSLAIGTFTAPPTFADVPVDYWAHDQIGTFAQRGITTGCDVGLYCPERPVTRAEMAVFLDRTLGYGSPATPTGQRFTDVPPAYWAYAFIDRFATLGITTGCGGTEYCPDRGVTRGEMAAFLIRALGQAQVTPGTPTFADVPPAHPQYGYIEALVKLGVTTGCGTNDQGQRVYCPDRGVTRAEMAVFITRAFP